MKCQRRRAYVDEGLEWAKVKLMKAAGSKGQGIKIVGFMVIDNDS
jgi:hypothetical protein